MFVLVSGRQGGKTYAICQWLLEDPNNRIIVVINRQRAIHLAELANRMCRGAMTSKELLERIVTPAQMEIGSQRGLTMKLYAIDNAEAFLAYFIRMHTSNVLEFVTFNGTIVGTPEMSDGMD